MTKASLIVLAGLAALAGAAHAQPVPQPPGVTRTELQRHDLSTPGREAIQMLIAVEPGVTFPPHRHPGEELIYVLQGTFEYQVDGRPVMVAAGGVLFIPAGAIHSARNAGGGAAVELATYLVEKGRPLVEIVR